MRWTRLTCALLTAAVLLLALQLPAANAAMISTATLIGKDERPQWPDPTDVTARLTALGVDGGAAAARTAAMTQEQRQLFLAQSNQAPAGGDVIGALAFAALVLLLTDILGYTDVYPFVTRTINGDKQAHNARADCVPAGTDRTAAAMQ